MKNKLPGEAEDSPVESISSKVLAVLLPPAKTAAWAAAIGVGIPLSLAPDDIGILHVAFGTLFSCFGLSCHCFLKGCSSKHDHQKAITYMASSGFWFGIGGCLLGNGPNIVGVSPRILVKRGVGTGLVFSGMWSLFGQFRNGRISGAGRRVDGTSSCSEPTHTSEEQRKTGQDHGEENGSSSWMTVPDPTDVVVVPIR